MSEQVTEAHPNPIEWVHSVPDACSSFVVGPWTALVGDPVETPPTMRVAGRYISRGFLRHTSGRSLGRDFPGNTQDEALLRARRWAEGSIQMWLKTLWGTVGAGPLSILPHLRPDIRERMLMVAFDSMKVAKEKGHHPPGAPVGIDALQPPAPLPGKPKGRRRKRRKR